MTDVLVRKAAVRLADGRALFYFGDVPERPADYPDRRSLAAVHLRPTAGIHARSPAGIDVRPQARWDRLLGEWVVIASHRQDRTFQPAEDQCPLCPSRDGRNTEVPAPEYEVVVFENRFPMLGGMEDGGEPKRVPDVSGQYPAVPEAADPLLASRPAGGRCEVVCFSQIHDASFADLTPAQAAIVMAAWADRSAELARMPGVKQVYCFENRGADVGVTLSHPHGQIYAYPYVTPRTDRMLRSCSGYRRATGRNLFDDLLQAEVADTSRIVLRGTHWIGFVPFAAHWPYEVHMYPVRRVPDLSALAATARAEFCELYLDLLRRFDRLFDRPAPYISAWHQAPVGGDRDDFALHLELFTILRAPRKLKYLAGSESGMGAFANDISPEAAAEQLRRLG